MATHHDVGLTNETACDVASRLAQLVGPCHWLPAPLEHGLSFELMDGRGGVPARWWCPGVLDGDLRRETRDHLGECRHVVGSIALDRIAVTATSKLSVESGAVVVGQPGRPGSGGCRR